MIGIILLIVGILVVLSTLCFVFSARHSTPANLRGWYGAKYLLIGLPSLIVGSALIAAFFLI